MLLYVWDRVDIKNQINLSIEEGLDLKNLFVKILINSSKLIIKKGIHKYYQNKISESRVVKGKLDIIKVAKNLSYYKKLELSCSYSDYTNDTLLNSIIVSTIVRVLKLVNVDKGLKNELSKLRRYFLGVKEIKLSLSTFTNIKFNRADSFYKFTIDVCRVIFENTLPLPVDEFGSFRFIDFIEDDKRMALIFEKFVRNFYKLEENRFKVVKKETILWNLTTTKKNDESYIPKMITDITLENDFQKIVIDTKFYNKTLSLNYEQERVKSENLYQLFSYLLNQEDGTEKKEETIGILLYPTVENEYSLDFFYKKHKIKVRTVNLNSDWCDIHKKLKEILID